MASLAGASAWCRILVTYLLDTNVVSELRKVRAGKAHPSVAGWSQSIPASSLFISAVTVHELEVGVGLLERRDAVQGAILRTWLDGHVMPSFAGRCLVIDAAVARASARLHVPHPIPFRDGLIAATALVHGLTVVTRNVADFAATGVSLINPWEDAGAPSQSG